MQIRHVPVEYIHQTWPLVKKFIDMSQTQGMDPAAHNYTTDQIQTYVSTGQWILIVAVDETNDIHGATVLSFINYPMHMIAFITAMGGKLITNKETFQQLEAIAKHHGATKIQALARPSMCRLMENYGFYPGNTLMEYKI